MHDEAKQEPNRTSPAWKDWLHSEGRGPGRICTPSRHRGTWEGGAWERGQGCLGVLRGRYLHSVFARHPRHAPFSLKEETEKR